MDVEYRELTEYPHYLFGSDGSIWSCNAGNKTREAKEWRKMNPCDSWHGHLMVTLYQNKTPKKLLAHRLIAMAFLGDIPEGKEVCHNDGNPANNCISNLRYDTRKGNLADRYKHGTMNCGTRQGHAKLDDNKIVAIFRMAKSGCTYNDIAKHFGVEATTIYAILHRITWRHVALPDDLLTVIRPSRNRKIVSHNAGHQHPLQSPIGQQVGRPHMERYTSCQ